MPAAIDSTRLSRRRALAAFIHSVLALLGGALAGLLGSFGVRFQQKGDSDRWLHAARLTDLTPGTPVPRILAVPVRDGWYRVRVPEAVFLIWDGERDVRAFSATCTHLGCQVHWDGKRQFICPCHGGVYDVEGTVIEGPPPRPLDRLHVRVDERTQQVLVRL